MRQRDKLVLLIHRQTEQEHGTGSFRAHVKQGPSAVSEPKA